MSLEVDYGVDFTQPGALRRWDRVVGPKDPPKGPGDYAVRVRRAAFLKGTQVGAPAGTPELDGRLLAVGYNHLSPRRMVETLPEWFAYWRAATARPDVVGSPYNAEPEAVWEGFWAGIPAHVVAAFGEHWKTGFSKRPFKTLLRQARAYARTSRGGRFLSSRLAARLGKLCPELQRAALKTLPRQHYKELTLQGQRVLSPWGVRDVDWEAVAQAQVQLAADKSGRIRAALSRGRRQNHLLDKLGKAGDALCPAFPRLDPIMGSRLVLGETPVDLAGGGLSKKEAHAWLKAYETRPLSPERWLADRVVSKHPELQGAALRDIEVIRWVDRQLSRPAGHHALTRLREIPGPRGTRSEVRYVSYVDELMAEDLRQSVDETFRSAARRRGESFLEQAREDHRVICSNPWGHVKSRRVRLLRTPAELAREGDEMSHCVGTYVGMVEAGNCYILAIRAWDARSTVKLDAYLNVKQHRGLDNAPPPDVCCLVLASWLRRAKRKRKR